jgi:xanthine dehydrogenase small subunit
MPNEINFLLNDREVSTSAPPGLLVLDYLRKTEKQMGTKEGCKEGDCGACVVLIGELDDDRVRYLPVTSCLVPLGELQAKHLVTVEGLNMEELSPVQQAIVDEGATQCGFCTPGIVVSLSGLLMDETKAIDENGVKYALSGHLCRCTGYRSLKNAAGVFREVFGSTLETASRIEALISAGAIPDYFRHVPAKLQKMSAHTPGDGKSSVDYFIAGGTDLYVQVGEMIPDSTVDVLNLHPEMKGIGRRNGEIHVGALTTFEEFADDHQIQQIIPRIKDFMLLNASWQIRNRATLGGNIINASPIADMTSLLLALESRLILKRGKKVRTVSLKQFYKGYKNLDKNENEILTEIVFQLPPQGSKLNFEKVSKRKCLDIASVNSSISVHCDNGLIKRAGLTMGGVAPIPLFLGETSDFLSGMPVTAETVTSAVNISQQEISPISDIRGSADYKRLLARQLLIAHFITLFPEHLKMRDFYETR